VKVCSEEIDEHKNLAVRMRNKKENGVKKREAMAMSRSSNGDPSCYLP
jgi:hypothetical protein